MGDQNDDWIEAEFQDLIATNPWTRVPLRAPFVLHEDTRGAKGYALTVLPGPWSGPVLTARVLLLLLNPGYEPGRDERDLTDIGLRLTYRSQLCGLAPFPWHLQHWKWSGAWEYWRKRLRVAIDKVGSEAVTTGLATVQLFPYHSIQRVDPSSPLGSAAYTDRIVRHALARGSLIVVVRGWEDWIERVRELAATGAEGQVFRAPYRRPSPYVTPGMLGAETFGRVIAALADPVVQRSPGSVWGTSVG